MKSIHPPLESFLNNIRGCVNLVIFYYQMEFLWLYAVWNNLVMENRLTMLRKQWPLTTYPNLR